MNRLSSMSGVRACQATACEAGRLAAGMLHMLWRLTWWLLSLPFRLLRWSVVVGEWTLRTALLGCFAVLGMVLLGQFLFGMLYVLAHPWLK